MEALVLAAGKGTRLRSERPKVLHEILGLPVLEYVLRALSALRVRRPKVIVGAGGEEVCSFLRQAGARLGMRPQPIWQRAQRGTGHAVMMAEASLAHYSGDLLIWPGDMPLLRVGTIQNFIREHRRSHFEVSVLSSLEIDSGTTPGVALGQPQGLSQRLLGRHGRILRAGGRFYAIREWTDTNEAEKRIQETNTGVYLFNSERLFDTLKKIRSTNAQKEYYLTDAIEILSKDNCRMEALPLASAKEAYGINSQQDLARAIHKMKQRHIEEHMRRGVTFVAPEATFIGADVQIGCDTVIHPWCYIESGAKIGRGCEIGPFAKIRKGSVIGESAIIGSFVEITRSRLGKKVMAKHLTYLGDAEIGEGTNVGAGTITANYDGRKKNRTRIGKKVLIGSNTVFVAPVSMGDASCTGAGAVVTRGSKIKKGEVVVGVPARPLRKLKR